MKINTKEKYDNLKRPLIPKSIARKKEKRKIIIISILSLISLFFYWWNIPQYVQPGFCQIAPDNIKKAMRKMGPYYDYKMINDVLYVNKGDNIWMKLNYLK